MMNVLFFIPFSMHQKLASFAQWMLTHASYFLLGSLLLLGSLIVTRKVDLLALVIPTDKATHTTTLSKVILGEPGDQQVIVFDRNWGRAVISGGLVVGEIGGTLGNKIAKEAINAIIAGGSRNTIDSKGVNASIGAGQFNSVSGANAAIWAGYRNTIGEDADNAFIGGGSNNLVSAPFSAVGAGVRNIVNAAYSVIPGGIDNTIGANAPYSFAAGQMTDIQHSGTFAWSDFDTTYQSSDDQTEAFTSTTPNTFLIRAKNGLAINTDSVPTGVNVNVGGAVYLGSQGLIYENCTPNLGGTFEQVKGCFFYCDGRYRHTIGLNLQGDDVGGWCRINVGTIEKEGKFPKIVTRVCLTSDGKRYHAGEYLTGYTSSSAPCTTQAVECGDNGEFRYKDTENEISWYIYINLVARYNSLS